MSADLTKYDSLFLTVAQTAGSVDAILDSFFSFMARKTDFLRNPELAKEKVETCLDRFIQSQTKIEEIPEAPKQTVTTSISATPTLNGGVTDRYRWTQTLNMVDLSITLPAGTRARDLDVQIGTENLRVALKGQAENLVSGILHAKIKDSTWTLDSSVLQISLDKLDGMKWWTCVFTGDTEIDTQKIVPENSKLSDLDGETRAMVEKMMFDQAQKAKGLPTSDQMEQHTILDKFKKAHPEMDFANAKVSYGGNNAFSAQQ